MKKLVALFLVMAVLATPLYSLCEVTPTISVSKFAFLDEMSLEDLLDLQSILSKRIDTLKTENAKNNPDDLGMWVLAHYVDEFGNPTNDSYIANAVWIKGKFSNSITEGAALNVRFLIDKDDVALQLYEYGGKNPVKVFDTTKYSIAILDSNGEKHTGEATEFSDRLYLPRGVLDILAQNGKISFYIIENSKYSNSEYSFTIEDTSYIGNALKLLDE